MTKSDRFLLLYKVRVTQKNWSLIACMTQKELLLLSLFFWLETKAHVDSSVAQIFPVCEKQKKSHRDHQALSGEPNHCRVIKKDIQLIQLIISKS